MLRLGNECHGVIEDKWLNVLGVSVLHSDWLQSHCLQQAGFMGELTSVPLASSTILSAVALL